MSVLDGIGALKRWKYGIALIVLAGCMGTHFYIKTHQTYTASMVIEYTHAWAANGQNPDGSPLDGDEILSPVVMTGVIKDLGLETDVEDIRSRTVVKEIIAQEEIEKQKAAWALGKEYKFIPTQFEVTFTTKGEDACTILDAIWSNYFSYYCEKYVGASLFANNAANVSPEQYEYIHCVEMMEQTIEEGIRFLQDKAELYPQFRSVSTGYSFADLAGAYRWAQENDVEGLYAYILTHVLARDPQALMTRYENEKEIAMAKLQNTSERAEKTLKDVEAYAQAIKQNALKESGGAATWAAWILSEAAGTESAEGAGERSAYDKLLNQYVALRLEEIALSEKIEAYEALISMYQSAEKGDAYEEHDIIVRGKIEQFARKIDELYMLAAQSVEEWSRVNGAAQLALRKSIDLQGQIDTRIYIALAAVFFTLAGSFLSVAGSWVDVVCRNAGMRSGG